jgi:hypothetical protein
MIRPNNPPHDLAEQLSGTSSPSRLSQPKDRDQRRHTNPPPPPLALLAPTRLIRIAHGLALPVSFRLLYRCGSRSTHRLFQRSNPTAAHLRLIQRR